MPKATTEELGHLHGLICQWSVDKLNEMEPVNAMTAEGPQTVGMRKAAKAADISVMTKFLSDNKISADAQSNAGLRAVEAELQKKARRSDNVHNLPQPSEAAKQIRPLKYAGEQQ